MCAAFRAAGMAIAEHVMDRELWERTRGPWRRVHNANYFSALSVAAQAAPGLPVLVRRQPRLLPAAGAGAPCCLRSRCLPQAGQPLSVRTLVHTSGKDKVAGRFAGGRSGAPPPAHPSGLCGLRRHGHSVCAPRLAAKHCVISYYGSSTLAPTLTHLTVCHAPRRCWRTTSSWPASSRCGCAAWWGRSRRRRCAARPRRAPPVPGLPRSRHAHLNHSMHAEMGLIWATHTLLLSWQACAGRQHAGALSPAASEDPSPTLSEDVLAVGCRTRRRTARRACVPARASRLGGGARARGRPGPSRS